MRDTGERPEIDDSVVEVKTVREDKPSFTARLKRKASDFFEGDEGSVFWAIEKTIEMIKLAVLAVNTYLSSKRAEKAGNTDE